MLAVCGSEYFSAAWEPKSALHADTITLAYVKRRGSY